MSKSRKNSDNNMPKETKNDSSSSKKDLFNKVNKRNIFDYDQFQNNDILTCSYTTVNVIMLLRNGTCISWGLNRATLGRRCMDANVDSYLPYPIKFPVRVVDIVCGRDHCLARGTDYKVYSWGFNNYGQVILY